MQMNIPATFGPICFSGSLEEDLNVYGRRRTPSDGNSSPDPSGEGSVELIKMIMEWCINLHRISLCDYQQ